jgi:CRISPR-associated endonuclease Csn1
MLSSKFMIACARIMREEDLPYPEAVRRLGLHHSDMGKTALRRSLPYYGQILSSSVSGARGESWDGTDEERYGRIANPTVHIALNQLRKLVNALVRRFGRPGEIILEINRELKLSKTRKDEIFREQTRNQKENERIKKELTDLGLMQISGEDIKKYKLWEELAPESVARRCPYCGRTISANQLISGSIEIEHILPYSRTLLNTRDNLTVAHRECNQAKKDLTPYEAFGNSPAGFDWNLISEMAASRCKKNGKWKKFYPDAMDRFHEETGGFLDKQLTDTAYLSKAGKDYLSAICDKNSIWVSTGKLTALLRGLWGFNTLLNRGHDTWFKNRSDHRHHALDALVIGLCDRSLVAKAARVNSGRGYRNLDMPPCPIKRQDIEKRLAAIIVSHKPDHGKSGKLYAETALAKHSYPEKIKPDELGEKEVARIIPKSIQQDIAALIKDQGFKKAKKLIQERYEYLRVFRDKWVTRAPLEALSERDIPNICDSLVREDIQNYIKNHPGQKLQDTLSRFSAETNIRSIRYFPKDQIPLLIDSCVNKAYMTGDFYRVDVWKIPQQKGKIKYEGVFISRPEAMRQLYNDTAIRRPDHPAAKRVMRLCKNDIIELSNEKQKELCRIAGFSATRNTIDIRPIYASDTIAAWIKNTRIQLTSSFWPGDCESHNFKSINVLFSGYRVKLVNITVDGRSFYRF